MATFVLTSELSYGRNNENNNILDKLLDHDPGKEKKFSCPLNEIIY